MQKIYSRILQGLTDTRLSVYSHLESTLRTIIRQPRLLALIHYNLLCGFLVGADVSRNYFPAYISYNPYNMYTRHTICILASCPWGPVTANGVDLLTKIYVIYTETHTSHQVRWSIR